MQARALMSDHYIEKRSQLPGSYVAYLEKHNGWEGDLGDYYGWVVILDKERIQEHWAMYEVAKYLPDYWFPFGHNGGGDMLCFDLRKKGDPTYLVPYIAMLEEDAQDHCVSFELIATEIEKKKGAI